MDVIKARAADLPEEEDADRIQILSDGRRLPGAKHEPVELDSDMIFRVTKPVDLDRLQDELKDEFKDRMAVFGASSPQPGPYNDRNPLTLYVAVEDQLRGDPAKVREILDAHEANPDA